MQTFLWRPANGARHAIPTGYLLEPGDKLNTLADEPITIPKAPKTKAEAKAQWLWPTCQGCWEAAKRCVSVDVGPCLDLPSRRASCF